MVFRLPDGAAMLTKSGREMPREQNDGWVAVLPAADDVEPGTFDATAEPSADDLPAVSNITPLISDATTRFINIVKPQRNSHQQCNKKVNVYLLDTHLDTSL